MALANGLAATAWANEPPPTLEMVTVVGRVPQPLSEVAAAVSIIPRERIEQTLAFEGLYFVLMGHLSPLDGIGPAEIHFDRLLARACDGVVTEVILATNFTQEGEATAHYIGARLRARGLKVSRLARGVPVGGELEYVDAATVAQAMRDRRRMA